MPDCYCNPFRDMQDSENAAVQKRDSLKSRRERQQSNVSRLLDSASEPTLMRRADTSQATRHNLAAFGNEALQKTHIPIWNRVNLLGAELADLLAAEKLSATARTTGARTAGTRTGGG